MSTRNLTLIKKQQGNILVALLIQLYIKSYIKTDKDNSANYIKPTNGNLKNKKKYISLTNLKIYKYGNNVNGHEFQTMMNLAIFPIDIMPTLPVFFINWYRKK
ncbi:Hypothetical protein CINCED_3A007101, partial [Cinara cedri]